MGNRFYTIVNYIIFLGGGIFLVWWQLKEMTPADHIEFNNALHYANYWLIIPIVIMSVLSHISRSLRWKLLLEPMGYHPALKNVFAVTMIGYLANSAVPRLGEILKCTFLARYEKLKVDKLVGSILIERTFDFICYLVFIAITILIQMDVVGNFVKEKISSLSQSQGIPLWIKLLILIAGIFTVLLVVKLMITKFPEKKIIIKINNFFNGIGIGFKSIKDLKKRKLFLAHTFFIWGMYLLQLYVGFHAMEGTFHLGIKPACSVLALATLAMIITPGGIGSFPLFVMQTLTVYSIASPVGKAFGWMIWGVTTGIVIVIGFISLLLLPYLNRKKNEIDQ